MKKMFSETILINHGASVVQNGFHNGEVVEQRNETSASAACFTGGKQHSGAFYRSHVVEKMYSVVGNGVTTNGALSDLDEVNGDAGEEVELETVEEVSCFVRSEIKWVFLKNVKVEVYGTSPIMTLQNFKTENRTLQFNKLLI